MKTRASTSLLVAALLLAATAHAAEMTIFKQPNFNGAQLTLRGHAPNLANLGFKDQASSIVVSSGRWELCTRPDFRGDCVTLDRGRYPTLDRRLENRIESAREVGTHAQQSGPSSRRQGPASVPTAPAPNLLPIEIFRGANFENGGYGTDRSMSQLDPEFDDKTSSAIVGAGQWELCTDRDYGGRCVVFGPGRYPNLGGLNNQVSSLRRIR